MRMKPRSPYVFSPTIAKVGILCSYALIDN